MSQSINSNTKLNNLHSLVLSYLINYIYSIHQTKPPYMYEQYLLDLGLLFIPLDDDVMIIIVVVAVAAIVVFLFILCSFWLIYKFMFYVIGTICYKILVKQYIYYL